ncbi:tellurite resistance TerB family protein [Maribacter sp. 1_2014MBL_MicDiv]|uniref:tellurite resistance TerB family protein n=1 Tax=Maribacter sp. 1_2014MBL_MicDiv TaxID=1644130 RepID=UPI0008F4808D|nr:TerB family tellurite resistance protein [Maribacter sp. 1_2014MBL_MicDiv]
MMNYTKEEKLAVVKMVDYVILADSKVAPAEMQFLTQLMDRFTFDSFFIGEARNLNKDLAYKILSTMSLPKKKALAQLLDEVALSDGFVHEKEILKISEALGHMEIEKELS